MQTISVTPSNPIMIRRISFLEIPKINTGNPMVRIEDKNYEWWGLFLKNQLCSFLAIDKQKTTNRVKHIFTFPNLRKKGLADILLKEIILNYPNLSSRCVEASKNIFLRNNFEITNQRLCGKPKQPIYSMKQKLK